MDGSAPGMKDVGLHEYGHYLAGGGDVLTDGLQKFNSKRPTLWNLFLFFFVPRAPELQRKLGFVAFH